MSERSHLLCAFLCAAEACRRFHDASELPQSFGFSFNFSFSFTAPLNRPSEKENNFFTDLDSER